MLKTMYSVRVEAKEDFYGGTANFRNYKDAKDYYEECQNRGLECWLIPWQLELSEVQNYGTIGD